MVPRLSECYGSILGTREEVFIQTSPKKLLFPAKFKSRGENIRTGLGAGGLTGIMKVDG